MQSVWSELVRCSIANLEISLHEKSRVRVIRTAVHANTLSFASRYQSDLGWSGGIAFVHSHTVVSGPNVRT